MENAVRPPTGLFATDIRWRLNRTALPPAGVTLRLKIGTPITAPATRLLALVHAPTVSPSLRLLRSSARQTSTRAPEATIVTASDATNENAKHQTRRGRCPNDCGKANEFRAFAVRPSKRGLSGRNMDLIGL